MFNKNYLDRCGENRTVEPEDISYSSEKLSSDIKLLSFMRKYVRKKENLKSVLPTPLDFSGVAKAI